MNSILPFRKRYKKQYKNSRNGSDAKRMLIFVEEMAKLINSILDPQDKAIITLLAKTGIWRNELIQVNLDDVNWVEQSLQLKPHPKN